jgi:hypothetical protein
MMFLSNLLRPDDILVKNVEFHPWNLTLQVDGSDFLEKFDDLFICSKESIEYISLNYFTSQLLLH